MPPVYRFAPSPTGRLHVGNARVALVNWLMARRAGGSFRLRLDDTDTDRSRPELAAAIETDLAWLGLAWDGAVARQSDRSARYAEAAAQLKAAGRLYPCYETPEELDLKRKSTLAQGKPPVYDRAALALTAAERARMEEAGRKPHWRFKLAPGTIAWSDMVRGPVQFDAAKLSDPVLLRADGSPLYHLPSVVDDIDMAVTHVVRGEDHVDNTALHIQLFAALGASLPEFVHLPLMLDTTGHKLSKRLGGLSLAELRDAGIEAMALNSYLARLGTADPVEPVTDLALIAERFDIAHMGRAAPRFDPDELAALNARLLHKLPFDAVRDRLAAIGAGAIGPEAWETLRTAVTRLSDIAQWVPVVAGAPLAAAAPDADRPHLAEALRLLPQAPWGPDTWGQWTKALGAATGRKGKELFMPLRRALTGHEHGPEMKALLPLIGAARARARLAAAAGLPTSGATEGDAR